MQGQRVVFTPKNRIGSEKREDRQTKIFKSVHGKQSASICYSCLLRQNPHRPNTASISGKTRIDRIQLPSGKQYHLCSIPYYLLSRLDDVIERFVSEGVRS